MKIFLTLFLMGVIILLESCVGCSNNNSRDENRSQRINRTEDKPKQQLEPRTLPNQDNDDFLEKSEVSILGSLPEIIQAEVIGIQDGDTIELKVVYEGNDAKERMGKNLRIRFLHIDCPEKGKDFFRNAKQFTSDACFRQVVKIFHQHEFDRYGRLLGEVILLNGDTLNRELVKNGLAVHYKKYSDDVEYSSLEINARLQKLGIWHEN